jgi:hypothetical protein
VLTTNSLARHLTRRTRAGGATDEPPAGAGASAKDQATWHLADGVPYFTPGSVGARGRFPRATRQLEEANQKR